MRDLQVSHSIAGMRLRLLEEASFSVLRAAAGRHAFWSVGFSGGKDSSVLVDLVLRFLVSGCSGVGCPKRILIIYSDTILDPPPIRIYARSVIDAINKVAREQGLPLEALAASPLDTGEDLVEMVIGRGYPAPSTRFRWCTDRWKLRPVHMVIKERLGDINRTELAIITGIRGEEAVHRRSREIAPYKSIRVNEEVGGIPYTPLLSWKTSDIWSYIKSRRPTWGTPSWDRLLSIYGGRDGLRMGCWVCTLVSRDAGWRQLVDRGMLSEDAYRMLAAWRELWLHFSRRRPDIWRIPKKRATTKNGRRWRYQYSKLRPEARLLLALALKKLALEPRLETVIGPLVNQSSRLDIYLGKLIEYRNNACRLLDLDKLAAAILGKLGLRDPCS